MSRPRALTPKDERRIQRLVRLRKQLTNAALARRYGVSKNLIGIIGNDDTRHRIKCRKAAIQVTSSTEPT